MTQSVDLPITNPYVGPRTFTENEGRFFFGREREARDLTARIVSEHLLLFYAQSGAGKSSLINARIIPRLRDEEGFQVLPVGRVSGELPPGVEAADNIYAFNLMQGLNQSDDNPTQLARVTLSDFLARLVRETVVDAQGRRVPRWAFKPELAVERPAASAPVASSPRFALIIDQFEEIITSHPAHWQERAAFFRQLNQALLEDPNLWVVLALREDYLASLDPYAEVCFNRLRGRFYMERMGVTAALDAIRKPAELGGRPFAPGVAEKLVDNLRQVRVPGQETTVPGQYVEPVQLQVVCYQLWERLQGAEVRDHQVSERSVAEGLGAGKPPAEAADVAPDERMITEAHLAEAGDVDRALLDFYEETLVVALADPASAGVNERQLRAWFDKELITEAGTRGLVRQGKVESGGLANSVVRALQRRFLVRGEARGGDVWFELVHDRFVEPIRQSNRAWFSRNLNPLTLDAQAWLQAGKPESKLYGDSQLAAALTQLQDSPADFGEVERAFLEAGQQVEARRAAHRQRAIAWGAAALSLVFIALAAWALGSRAQVQVEAQAAQIARDAAVSAQGTAEYNRNMAEVEAARADLRGMVAETAYAEARVAKNTAEAASTAAIASAETAEAERAIAQAANTAQVQAMNELEAVLQANLTALAMAAEAPSLTPTTVPTPSPTPTGVTPITILPPLTPQPTLTGTPTRTSTPVPSPTANLLVVAQQTQLAQVNATQTALAQMAKATATAVPRPSGRIVFASNRQSNADLYSVNVDGTGTMRLTFNGGWEPSHSPVSDQIVFTNDPERDPERERALLFTIPAAGGQPVNIGGTTNDNWEPALSRDGRRVAFTTSRDNDWEIYAMNTGGGAEIRLTNSPGKDAAPAWSPDGQRIAFSSERANHKDRPKIWVMNADGGNPRQLTFGESIDVYPAWSPDGRQIAFASTRSGRLDIWVMDTDGLNLQNITQSAEDENYPSWSPDGKWLACLRYTTNEEIFIVSLDGRTAINVTKDSASDWQPAWLP